MVDWEAEGKVMPDFDKLENQKRQGPQREGDLPLWAARQQKVFTNWINNKVCDRPLSVCDLFVDLQDGTVLYGLLEVLSKQSLAVLGKVKPERNKIKKIANMNIVWKYLGNTVKLVGIGPTDIVDGNVTLTLGMIWSLIVFFMALDLGDAGDGLTVLKKRIMEWMTRRTKDFPDVEVTNFTTSLADGRVLLAILNDYDPSQSPYKPSSSPADNLRRAFEDFQRLYGVGSILDPDDPQCCEDEKANITYLAELMKAMPEYEDDDGEGGGRRGRKGVREAAAVVTTRQAAIKISEDSFPETVVGRLRELCAFGPGDGAACASRVAKMMRDAGLGDVKVVEPSQGREDASMRGDPIVVGEKAGPPGSPTVLFYASYGTVDESSEAGPAEGSGSPAQGSTINNDIERWASDPLCLTPTKRPSSSSPSQAAGSPKGGERLAARGSAQDKANVVCQIAAVEAMLEGGAGLPCGVKVVVGATPPPGSLAGDAPLEVADRLADFLRAHPSLAGLPDLVVVSEPAGSRLAPDKNALLVGCRGFAFLEVAVSTFGDGSGHRRGCADFGGPLIDPARVLANIVASLHHPETGELRVEGVSDLAPKEGEALAEAIGGLRYGEGQLRRDTGYSSEVACARGVCYKPGGSSPDKSTTTTTMLASVAEQLALLPAVSITSISTTPPNSSFDGGGGGGSLLGSRFPSTATAGIHMCLPPGAEYASAVRALQSHCAKRAPHGAKVRFDKVLGRAGWLAPTSGSPMVSGVLASLREEDDGEAGGPVEGGGRETVLASDPGFSAIPSAFARALPDSAVVGLGVNDPESKGGAANESVLVDDLKGFVRSAVRLVHGVAESGGKKEKAGSSSGGVKEGAGEDAPTAYSNRFIDDLDRRNAVNQLRGGKLSNVSSPAGSANTTPRGTNSRGITHSGAGGSPVRSRSPASRSPSRFSTLERNLEREGGGGGAGGFAAGGVGGGPLTPNAKHPLSPNRPPSSATTAGLSPADSASIAELLQSSPLAPRLPPAPSAAMAAFAAAALGDAAGGGGGRGGAGDLGVMTPPPPGGGAGMAGDEDDDKVGGGTPETVLAEINELRADPKGYATKLEALEEFYDKGMYQSPTGPPVQTTEGVKPLLEVVAMLKTTEALAPLESKEGMQQAAADHVKDLAETSRTGHSGSDGSGAADRMNRYGQFFQVAGEVCTYFDATAEGIVAQLLVSDGERSRHNRKALLAAHFKVCGIAIGTHPTVGAACVITLAGGYGPRPLSRSADVVCEAGSAPSAEFREVLESIPVPQITEEVSKCVEVGMEVQLQYTPGSIKCTFVQASGARKSMGCKWA